MAEKVTVAECLQMVLWDKRVKKLEFGVGVTLWSMTGEPLGYLVSWSMTWKGDLYGNAAPTIEYGIGERRIPEYLDAMAADFKSVYQELKAEDDMQSRVGG